MAPSPPPCATCGAPTVAHTIRAPIRGVLPGVRNLRYHVTLVWRCTSGDPAHDTVRATASSRGSA